MVINLTFSTLCAKQVHGKNRDCNADVSNSTYRKQSSAENRELGGSLELEAKNRELGFRDWTWSAFGGLRWTWLCKCQGDVVNIANMGGVPDGTCTSRGCDFISREVSWYDKNAKKMRTISFDSDR